MKGVLHVISSFLCFELLAVKACYAEVFVDKTILNICKVCNNGILLADSLYICAVFIVF